MGELSPGSTAKQLARQERIANLVFNRLLNKNLLNPEKANAAVLSGLNEKYTACANVIAQAGVKTPSNKP
jgi:hypothetical protein